MNIDFKTKKYIFFYKTSILSDDDIKIPKNPNPIEKNPK